MRRGSRRRPGRGFPPGPAWRSLPAALAAGCLLGAPALTGALSVSAGAAAAQTLPLTQFSVSSSFTQVQVLGVTYDSGVTVTLDSPARVVRARETTSAVPTPVWTSCVGTGTTWSCPFAVNVPVLSAGRGLEVAAVT